MLLLPMKLPIRIPITVDAHSAQIEHRLGAVLRPAHARLLHAVFDQVAAGALDHACADWPALRQIVVVVHIRLVALIIADRALYGRALRLRPRWAGNFL